MNLSDESPGPWKYLERLPGSQFLFQGVADRGCRRGLRRFVLLDLLALDLPDSRTVAQADAPRLRADLNDLEIVFLAGFQRAGALQGAVGRAEIARTFVAALALLDFGVMAEPFDVFAELHERAKRGDTRNLATHDVAHLVLLEPITPDVVHLLHAQGHPAILGINPQHFRGNRFALFEHFVRVLHPAGPAYVADVHQSVKALFDFDERAELGNVAHLAGHDRADGILLRHQQPGIGLRLLDAQRNATVAWLDVQHHHVHFVADLRQLRGVRGLLGPGHFRNVHQAFDALFQLHEHAVVHHADDLALVLAARAVALSSIHPGIFVELLQAQRNALLALVKLQNNDVEFLFRLHHVARMPHAAPAHVGEVQQAVNAAEVHERAVFGHILDGAVNHLPFAQLLHQLGALGVQLFFQQRTAADHHVAAAAIQLGDAHLHFLAEQSVEVLGRAQVILRARQKCAYTDIDDEAALDAIHDFRGQRFLGFELRVNLFPGAAAQHLLIRNDDEIVLRFAGALYFDGGVGIRARNFCLREFGRGNEALGLSAEVHN